MSKSKKIVFPRKLAEGSAFCNREDVRKQLAREIENVEHTVLVSPRRYGKTSLVLKVVDDLGLPFGHVDLFLAINANRVVDRFLEGAAQLMNSMLPNNVQAVKMAKAFFKNFNLSLGVGAVSVGIKFDPPRKQPDKILREVLEGMEAFLHKQNKKAVFFVDEIQDIIKLPFCSDVEAALRSCAQKSKHISFVFSGSNRKLLKKLFDDSSRPLWKICKRINLDRISKDHYVKFLNLASKQTWKKELSVSALDEILDSTECHPYYVNYLCSELWRQTAPPQEPDVEQVWMEMCRIEGSAIAEALAALRENQKAMLLHIAKQGVLYRPSSSETMTELNLTSRGALQSLKGLMERDFVEKIIVNGKEGYRVLDPLMKQVLLNGE
jgi:hypothetical protein